MLTKGAEYARRWRQKHPARSQAQKQRYRDTHKTQIRASAKRRYLERADELRREYRRRRAQLTPAQLDQLLARKRAARRRLRRQALQVLGNKCQRCGFSDYRALQIDHKNGGGVQELRSMAPTTYLKKVIRLGAKKYQLLCANHNWIKRYQRNEATPKRKRV